MPGMAVHAYISEPGRFRQENREIKASLDYIVSPCLKEKTDRKSKRKEEGRKGGQEGSRKP
jgi:hypothetical protein